MAASKILKGINLDLFHEAYRLRAVCGQVADRLTPMRCTTEDDTLTTHSVVESCRNAVPDILLLKVTIDRTLSCLAAFGMGVVDIGFENATGLDLEEADGNE